MDANTCLIERSQVREILITAITLDNDTTNALLSDVDSLPIVTLRDAETAVERLQELVDRLKLEAKGHAQEARTANATIAEAYQAVTGAKGEPGNWNGAVPIRTEVERLRGLVQEAYALRERMPKDWVARAADAIGEGARQR